MKTFIATYESAGNLEKGRICLEGHNAVDAQDKFFDWLKEQPLYSHMWQLSVQFEEIEGFIK